MADNADKAVTLTHSQSVNRLKEITSELERLAELDDPTRDDESYFNELTDEFRKVDAYRKKLERNAKLGEIRSAADGIGSLRITPGAPSTTADDYDRDVFLEPDSVEDKRFRNPWDLGEVRTFGRSVEEVGQELRSRALSAVEKMPGASDRIRSAATDIIERFDDKESTIAKMALATSSPEYLRAWSKMARNAGHTLSQEEARAMEAVRAMSLSDSSGGYLVPFQLDPTVIITSNGSRNDIRRASRQVVATGDVWNGVSSGAVAWSWDGEAAQVSDDSTTFAQPNVPVHKAQGFVPISIEALEDEHNVTQEVGRLLAFGKDELEAVAFITGDGVSKPTGIIHALDGTASEVSPATPETFALADVYGLQGSLPARYRAQASWLANNLTYNRVRQFDTSGGGGFWTNLNADRPPQLLGRDALEAEAMDATFDPSATADNFLLLFGDFQHYVIADRIGMTVEFIPHLFGANQRPTGQRGWYAYYRVGADSVHDGAFRVLNVATTA